MKLKPMTDFVLELWDNELMSKIGLLAINYAQFLKTPLKLEMFVPCDKKGNILKEPINYSAYEVKMSGKDFGFNFIDCQEYEIAKDKVLFEGFELKEELEFVYKFKHKGKEFNVLKNELPIEWLVGDEIELTPNAIKRIFG